MSVLDNNRFRRVASDFTRELSRIREDVRVVALHDLFPTLSEEAAEARSQALVAEIDALLQEARPLLDRLRALPGSLDEEAPRRWYYAGQSGEYAYFTEAEWGARYDFTWVLVGDDAAKAAHERTR